MKNQSQTDVGDGSDSLSEQITDFIDQTHSMSLKGTGYTLSNEKYCNLMYEGVMDLFIDTQGCIIIYIQAISWVTLQQMANIIYSQVV